MIVDLPYKFKMAKTTAKCIAAILVSLTTLLIYLPALINGFVNWDDDLYVYGNPNIKSLNLRFLKWLLTAVVSANWHPLTVLSFAIDYSWWDNNAFGYHLTNIVLHFLNTFIVFILITELMKIRHKDNRAVDSRTIISASITSLLFGIHPLHVESAAWISERKDVLYSFFYLLAVLSYLKYNSTHSKKKRTAYYTLCLLLFVLSCLSKPMAVTFPVVLFILDLYPLRRSSGTWTDVKSLLIEKAPFFVLSFILSAIAIYSQKIGGAIVSLEQIPFSNRLIVALYSYSFYIVKMVYPSKLVPYYPYPMASEIYSAQYLTGVTAFIAITFFSIWGLKKKWKAVAFCWFYYIVTLIPVAGFINIGFFSAADRYTYLPSIGLFLLAGVSAASLFEKFTNSICKIAFFGTLITVFGLLSLATMKQITVWHDSITLWTHQINIFPVARAYNNRGNAYYALGNYQMAIKDISKAIKLNPMVAEAYNNRGNAYFALSNYELAIEDISNAIEINPMYADAYYNRGNIYHAMGNHHLSIKDLSRAIELNPQFGDAYNNRGNAYYALGNYQMAIKDINKAIAFNPLNADAYYNRGVVYSALGKYLLAIDDYTKVIELNPLYKMAYYNLGSVYHQLGNTELGLFYKRKAAGIDDLIKKSQ